ncbi:MFS transporter [Nocardioides guangzhouensis]|uniref:Multidrug efflux pump Tap n=1 Tax=Nocardioides guangzhouensis TaxID=2497878 RepID=A0A4Q4ZFP6_9ACTN|nr:MFS transporter [Nocardioides guangzhouensis]RYP86236.1 MFS transporter [Nocardioides guangzhouensis]
MTHVATPPDTPAVAPPTGGSARTPYRVRAPRALAALVLANAVSLSGNVVMTVAIPWLVLTTSGSAALAGAVTFAGAAGATVGGLAAGRVVDLLGAVRAGAVSDLISALAVVPVPVLLAFDALEVRHLVLLVVLGTVADAAGAAARHSLVPAAADAGRFPRERANAMFTSAEHAGYLLGAPLAGVLIATVGVGGALLVTVAAFGFAALVLARLHERPAPREAAAPAVPAGLRETAAFIRRDPALRALFLFPTVAVLLVGPLAPLLLPVLAREAFGDPVVLGLMIASYGVGGLLGAALFGTLGARVPRRRLYVGVFVVLPTTFAVIALLPLLPVTLAMLLALGAAAGSLVPLQATIRQERSPAHLLPRVVGLSTASIPVAAPIGVLGAGLLIDSLGLHRTLLLMTAGAALIGVAAFASRGVRLFDARPDAACTEPAPAP